MKRSMIAAGIVFSLGFCAQAMAKDVDALDVVVGKDIVAVAKADGKLFAEKKTLETLGVDMKDADAALAKLAAYGINVEKDLKSVVITVNAKGDACAVVDASVSLKAFADSTLESRKAIDAANVSVYKNYSIIAVDKDINAVLVGDKRIVACDTAYDMPAIIDNLAKPKTLKSRDKVLYDAFAASQSSADIRIGAKLWDAARSELAAASLTSADGSATLSVADADSASLSISLAPGLAIEAKLFTKSEAVAKSGVIAINSNLDPILSDPSFADMGVGFIKDAVKISAAKKAIVGNVNLTEDQINKLIALYLTFSAAAESAAK